MVNWRLASQSLGVVHLRFIVHVDAVVYGHSLPQATLTGLRTWIDLLDAWATEVVLHPDTALKHLVADGPVLPVGHGVPLGDLAIFVTHRVLAKVDLLPVLSCTALLHLLSDVIEALLALMSLLDRLDIFFVVGVAQRCTVRDLLAVLLAIVGHDILNGLSLFLLLVDVLEVAPLAQDLHRLDELDGRQIIAIVLITAQ